MNKDKYENRYQELQKEKTELKNKFNKVSMLRLISVAAAVVSICISRSLPFILACVICIMIFLYLIGVHSGIEKDMKLLEAEETVVYAYIGRFTGGWKKEADNGEQFLCENYPQGRDLDIFGNASLYQLLCQAYTLKGKKKFADTLRYGCKDIAEILRSQEAIKEICEKNQFRDRFEICSALLEGKKNKNNPDSTETFKKLKTKPVNIFFKMLMWLLPVADVVLIILFIINISPEFTAPTACFITAVSFLLSCIQNAVSNGVLKNIDNIQKCIHSYSEIIDLIDGENFKSQKLANLKKIISDTSAKSEIKKFEEISNFIEMRTNAIAFFLYNAFFMWDVHCIDSFVKWYNKNGKNIEKWLDAIAEFESLISFAVITKLDISYSYPKIHDLSKPVVKFRNLRHPLISANSVIGNSASFEPSSVIITGSNMSGKTTFMRSIGVNLILANAGAPVASDEFTASFMDVMSSMRTQDSVSDGISTFYAELLRIKDMVEYAALGRPVIMLIDEIFKGTNSKDRIACAEETIKQISGQNTITIVTTHDFELCSVELEKQNVINYHFSEYYENDKIKFDYKIKDGKCTTTNARQLLKMVGIIK